VLDPSSASSDQLKEFATLVRSTPHLTDVGRATFIEWIALVHGARNEKRLGLSYAHDAYRLRRRALGASHPQCAASLRLIESLRHFKTKSALLEDQPSEDSEEASIETSAHWHRATEALESGAADDLARALLELRTLLDEADVSPAASEQDQSAVRALELLTAEILLELGQHAEAELLLIRLAKSEASRASVGRPATLLLSDAYFDAGKLRECAAVLREFDTPADQSERIALLWRTIRLESALGIDADVEHRFVEAFSEASKLRPRDHRVEALLHHELAEQLLVRRVYKGAFAHATAAATKREVFAGEFHRSSIDSKRVVARTMAGLGQHQEAARQLSRLLELSKQAQGDQANLTLRIQLDLAITLSESRQFDQNQAFASELFAQAQSGLTALFTDRDARTLEAIHARASHRLREGRPTSAAKLLRDVVENRRAVLGASALATLESARDLAQILEDLGATAEATALLEGNLESCLSAFETNHWLLERATNDLSEHYRLHNRSEEEQRARLEQVASSSRKH